MINAIVGDVTLRDVTIIIDPSRSTCGACGRGASPHEDSHKTIVEYGPDIGKPGCGAVWTHVSSNYMGLDLQKRYANQYPDLIWNGMDEQSMYMAMAKERNYD